MPLAQSFNVNATANEQPEYQMLWEPYAVNPSSAVTAITIPTTAGAGAWVAGALLMFTNAGIGTNPGPGGDDYGGVTTPYTVQTVDIAATTTTTFAAGVLLGVGALGANSPVAPNTLTGRLPSQVAMVGKRGLCQVLCDSTTTVGHTLIGSTSHTGQFSDSGGTTRTYGTCFGIILQAVTISAGPLLVWAYVNFP
jgi:hypothetical protein